MGFQEGTTGKRSWGPPPPPARSTLASPPWERGLWSADGGGKDIPAGKGGLAELYGFQNTQFFHKMTGEHSVLLSAAGFLWKHLLLPLKIRTKVVSSSEFETSNLKHLSPISAPYYCYGLG